MKQDADFAELGDAYEAAHAVPRHTVGPATARFLKQRPLIDWAGPWIEQHRGAHAGEP